MLYFSHNLLLAVIICALQYAVFRKFMVLNIPVPVKISNKGKAHGVQAAVALTEHFPIDFQFLPSQN